MEIHLRQYMHSYLSFVDREDVERRLAGEERHASPRLAAVHEAHKAGLHRIEA